MVRIIPLAAMLAVSCTGATAAFAQTMPEPDMTEVAKTPLRDLNIDGRDIPEVLVAAAADPYALPAGGTCNALVSEIAALDTVLGADYDIANDDGNDRFSQGRIGQSVVGSILPFRGILREVTGAAGNDRALRAAYTAGMVRRSFLKGLGLGKSCAYPAQPKERSIAAE
ncbi:hypothetical protein [Erythrobacter sp. R86502]|uniref:hypothetical protein n=1 Tax=Erythrobacter sp. R86502 TaxID=3093846 RepID=UPI0036D3C71F